MENSPFNKLSAELRNEIYKLVLVVDEPINVCYSEPNGTGSFSYLIRKPFVQPALTQVCKQVRTESLHILYHRNSFRFLLRDNITQRLLAKHINEYARWLRRPSTVFQRSIRPLKLVIKVHAFGQKNSLNWWLSMLLHLTSVLRKTGWNRSNISIQVLVEYHIQPDYAEVYPTLTWFIRERYTVDTLRDAGMGDIKVHTTYYRPRLSNHNSI